MSKPTQEPRARRISEPEGDPLARLRQHVDSRLRRRDGTRCQAGRHKIFCAYRARLAEAAGSPPLWRELGPQPLAQRLGIETEVSGRVVGVAVVPDNPQRVYLAAANGGVWRSENGGSSWVFTMASFDLDPQGARADTLACGAIAVAPGNPERVYVGTGEGGEGELFGIGPLVSRWGDSPNDADMPVWEIEGVDTKSPPLLGESFYQLAISPGDREIVLAATTAGLYRREVVNGLGRWHQIWGDVVTSVVAGCQPDGTAVFVAADKKGVRIVEAARHADSRAWRQLGPGFPTEDLGPISLALSGESVKTVFALVATEEGGLKGIYRWTQTSGEWVRLASAPSPLLGESGGLWSLAIAVDPRDAARFFVGGTTVEIDGEHLAALYRCRFAADDQPISYTFAGYGVHADIQALTFESGSSGRLWVACDGGVFFAESSDAEGLVFASRNETLATVTLNHIGQHPETEELYCGSQDNGVVHYRRSSGRRWETVIPSDSGHVVVNWANPRRILASIFDEVLAQLDPAFTGPRYVEVPLEVGEEKLFYPPLAGVPMPEDVGPHNQHQAGRVAYGSVRVWISERFGDAESWFSIPSQSLEDDKLPALLRSLCFASYQILYAGTEGGDVFRFDFDPATQSWSRNRLADLPGPVWFGAPITDIAIDPADLSGGSIYVTLGGPLEVGGKPDFRRLWHYDGASGLWSSRSGPKDGAADRLLPVHHNAVAADPQYPQRIWVGADIGVWYSENAGQTWRPFQNGLPDASVVDLKLHPKLRLLRAATHGRGCFEVGVDF